MATFTKFQVGAHPEDARTVLQDVLSQWGYRSSWEDTQQGMAEKGSKTKAMLLGALAIHYKYNLRLDVNADSSVTVSVFLGTTGVSGGAVGYSKVRSELDRLQEALRSGYEAKGILRQVEAG